MLLEQIAWKDKRGYHGYVKVKSGEHVRVESVEDPLTVLTVSTIELSDEDVELVVRRLNEQRGSEQRQSLQVDAYSSNRTTPTFGIFEHEDCFDGYKVHSVNLFRYI